MIPLRIQDQVVSIHCAVNYEGDSLKCNSIAAAIDYDDLPSLVLPHHESDHQHSPVNGKWCVGVFRWVYARWSFGKPQDSNRAFGPWGLSLLIT
jgi:hypothetical protein